MRKTALLIAFIAGCGTAPAALTALQMISPSAVDALTQLVQRRWGTDAVVDTDSMGCFEAPKACADLVGDDYRDFEYACCRAKAVE